MFNLKHMKKTRTEKKSNKWVSWHLKGGKWGGKNKKSAQSFRLLNINSKENDISTATTEYTMDTEGENNELWRRGAGCDWNEQQVVPQGLFFLPLFFSQKWRSTSCWLKAGPIPMLCLSCLLEGYRTCQHYTSPWLMGTREQNKTP